MLNKLEAQVKMNTKPFFYLLMLLMLAISVSAAQNFTISAEPLTVRTGSVGYMNVTVTNTGDETLNSLSYSISRFFVQGLDIVEVTSLRTGTIPTINPGDNPSATGDRLSCDRRLDCAVNGGLDAGLGQCK